MFHLIITLDYELPGDGCGDVIRHMIQPTSRLLEVCERHGAVLTIMAEMGEIWAFENPLNLGFVRQTGIVTGKKIRHQLIEAINRGHDVQLHLHPQWLNAQWTAAGWMLNYANYRLTDLCTDDAISALRRGKEDLETLLCDHNSGYRCVGFRAGHWNAQPSTPYLAALKAAGLKSDTSVFKWGFASGKTSCFDYRDAYSNLDAWYADDEDINAASTSGDILEVPISAELVPFLQMVSLHRLRLACAYWQENRRISKGAACAGRERGRKESPMSRLARFLDRYPMKLDFCKLSGPQMLSMVERLIMEHGSSRQDLPIPLVMIGHSKQAGAEQGLDHFLGRLKDHFGNLVQFTTYQGFVEHYRSLTRGKGADAATA